MTPELLTWLQGDDFFKSEALQRAFQDRKAADRKVMEDNSKVEWAGYFQDEHKGRPINGLVMARPFFERFRIWWNSFRTANRAKFLVLGDMLKRELRDIPADELGKNGEDLLNTCPSDWMFIMGTLQLAKPGQRIDPRHFDGGAALLIAVITLYGNRRIRCYTAASAASAGQADSVVGAGQADSGAASREIVWEERPGSFYFATLCGASHQVEHDDRNDEGDNLLHVHGVGPIKVVALARCFVFRNSRGSITANPKGTFDVAQRVAAIWLQTVQFDLPMLPGPSYNQEHAISNQSDRSTNCDSDIWEHSFLQGTGAVMIHAFVATFFLAGQGISRDCLASGNTIS